MKFGLTLVVIISLFSYELVAQKSPEQILEWAGEQNENHRSYFSFVTYTYFSDEEGKVTSSEANGTFKRSSDGYRLEIGDDVRIANENYWLTIDNDAKIVAVGKTYGNVAPEFDPKALRKLLKISEARILSDSKDEWMISLSIPSLPDSPFKEVIVSIQKGTGHYLSLDFIWNVPDDSLESSVRRMKISYDQISVSQIINKDAFAIQGAYLNIEGRAVNIVSPEFKDFQLTQQF
ncbi:MAG: hypothetical protein MK081_14710 [Flavobacteriales bacterium]|nr:hypothetical protein [Flavobacteriales bacterium]